MNSVFIETRPVATAGTDHAAVSETDMILVDGKPPAVDYVNDARSKDVTGSPARTFILGKKVWTEDSTIPVSRETPEAPAGVGEVSGTWRKETKATSTCQTVFVEGRKVIRLDDPTVQNHMNCNGKVMTAADADAIVAKRNARGNNASVQASAQPPRPPRAPASPPPASTPGRRTTNKPAAQGGRNGQSGGRGNAENTTAEKEKIDHFRIELKAWIPLPKVVDPEEPMRISDWAEHASSYLPGGIPPDLVNYEYHSYYRGDNHVGYDGSFRAISWIEFDWNGGTILRAKGQGDYGATHRDYDWRITVLRREIRSGKDTEAKKATNRTWYKSTATTFELGIASANPLVIVQVGSPNIDSKLKGTVGGSTIQLSYETDLFPSHGLRVIKNGTTIYTGVVLDASKVTVLGPVGAANLAYRLNSLSNKDTLTVQH